MAKAIETQLMATVSLIHAASITADLVGNRGGPGEAPWVKPLMARVEDCRRKVLVDDDDEPGGS